MKKSKKSKKKGVNIPCCSISGYVSPHHCPRVKGWLVVCYFFFGSTQNKFFLFFNRKEKSKGEAQNVEVDNKEDKGE